MAPVLQINDLSTHIKLTKSVVQAVGNIDLRIEAGETLGLVGESGCGKSMTGLSIMGLLPPGGSIVGGSITLDGRELVGLPGAEVLGLVGLPRPAERLSDYPHQLSGGLRQRVMIAMALSCEPKLLIADEPTTALDVTIQAQILELLKTIQDRTDSALMLITHDLGVVAEMVQDVVVMYAGQVVETGTVEQVLLEPRAPYTMGLIESIPTVDKRGGRLSVIKGTVPSPFNLPPACRFEPRCPYAWGLCRKVAPDLFQTDH